MRLFLLLRCIIIDARTKCNLDRAQSIASNRSIDYFSIIRIACVFSHILSFYIWMTFEDNRETWTGKELSDNDYVNGALSGLKLPMTTCYCQIVINNYYHELEISTTIATKHNIQSTIRNSKCYYRMVSALCFDRIGNLALNIRKKCNDEINFGEMLYGCVIR